MGGTFSLNDVEQTECAFCADDVSFRLRHPIFCVESLELCHLPHIGERFELLIVKADWRASFYLIFMHVCM